LEEANYQIKTNEKYFTSIGQPKVGQYIMICQWPADQLLVVKKLKG